MGHATITIGPRGSVSLVQSNVGPQRVLRAVHFYGRVDVGTCPGDFKASDALVAVADMTKGRVVTSSFSTLAQGTITEADTGGLGSDGLFTGHDMIAFVISDTGTIG